MPNAEPADDVSKDLDTYISWTLSWKSRCHYRIFEACQRKESRMCWEFQTLCHWSRRTQCTPPIPSHHPAGWSRSLHSAKNLRKYTKCTNTGCFFHYYWTRTTKLFTVLHVAFWWHLKRWFQKVGKIYVFSCHSKSLWTCVVINFDSLIIQCSIYWNSFCLFYAGAVQSYIIQFLTSLSSSDKAEFKDLILETIPVYSF